MRIILTCSIGKFVFFSIFATYCQIVAQTKALQKLCARICYDLSQQIAAEWGIDEKNYVVKNK